MRWKFGRRQSAEYTCCFCCHVRMGTMFLGIFYLLLDLLALTMIVTVTLYPDLARQECEVLANYLGVGIDSNSTIIDGNGTVQVISLASDSDNRQLTNRQFALILLLGYSVFTISLLYGVITGRPKYLLPFFCLQVFDFCATSFSFICYFSFEPDIKMWIKQQKLFPFKEELLSMSTDWLLILAALTSVAVLWMKGYCVTVVWSCYKYLVHGDAATPIQSVTGTERSYDVFDPQDQAENFSPGQVVVLPPKYEDVVNVPILASQPPPPYAAMETEASLRN